MSKENTLYVSLVCGGCKGAIDAAKQPRFEPYVELVDVNTPAGNQRMVAAGVYQTPVMITRDQTRVAGPRAIYEYLSATYR